jgi:predicted RNA-binding protein with PUA-like domain
MRADLGRSAHFCDFCVRHFEDLLHAFDLRGWPVRGPDRLGRPTALTSPDSATQWRFTGTMAYWLMKSEPDVFGIDDLKRVRREPWDGVRNYQVRNMMRDDMRNDDLAFFYHSNCEQPGITGIMRILGSARPDPAQFDPASRYYDPKSIPDDPRWLLVDVGYKRKLKRNISLQELKLCSELAELPLVRRGNRLSVMPVTAAQWDFILALE